MRKHCPNVCKFRPCLATESTNSARMRTIVTAVLQRQYLQTELILLITLVYMYVCMYVCMYVYLCVCVSLCVGVCSRSQWPRGLRRRSTAARMLRLWIQIPPEA